MSEYPTATPVAWPYKMTKLLLEQALWWESRTLLTHVTAVKESKIIASWQLRKAMIFYSNEHIVIDFDGNE